MARHWLATPLIARPLAVSAAGFGGGDEGSPPLSGGTRSWVACAAPLQGGTGLLTLCRCRQG